jgi:hypothetical protein
VDFGAVLEPVAFWDSSSRNRNLPGLTRSFRAFQPGDSSLRRTCGLTLLFMGCRQRNRRARVLTFSCTLKAVTC